MAYEFLAGKSVLVTGGTGSFGQKFIRKLLSETKTRRIIVFSRDELKQSKMQVEISDPEGRLRFFLGDVRDAERLQRAFFGVNLIVHAAALKQVPMLEYNPFEAIKTNIIGTKNVIDAAIDNGVKQVVLVSTDKAANPANLYGATKLCAEKLMVSSNAYSGGATKLSVVRYGNVFGSRGSIVDVIKQQKLSGEVTITHEDMTRFWITLDQGVELVLMTLEKMVGGEIFIPQIPSMRLEDFIKAIAPECTLKTIGIRPGEKLHETLITPEEARNTRQFGRDYVILPDNKDWHGHENYKDYPSVSSGFTFSSNTNTQWVTHEELQALINSV
ncbi:MAG: UDP-N-acetylglucosamine 4,6-dehydratase (inverting) [Candidatus Magasanikbacteria bacterium RIFCSPHIGHO2_01_FULL_41_23]|uniref:UDP-N-acetylglucosamine 4,6-dehydratase (Inverting) n=1 Tax=Candidatus Magasanikbacteria bacterium RIFCSPLOWO2_01_FULL_40_15 TaxID=1798686 RepID=A0A1F6N3T4_9BACT|nr:MAG: UDP-N-acetylglucosamine 4,6-dehydratase (inverting) [Candidatus Magasanikbacteria bacterium RIFCSPHIGHO2_01_FULL_41_23]OGH76623.1 MAG: UDP-N-acetylglucosamine 4,6-dehydratase (inverting) [Candidatus Magasanikbacteria bacterium RIFCSPHIGHO2_12_FULL_41_16]OGH78534.1 MAG: UDP-N-acetylglucosamine 4,6-dehydratase (inverting) [Candidatus Magasanikbacteria bacterium RIFCSPLOWO2_01_FULL_40_15]